MPRASRWDTDAEIGGGWRIVLRRQVGDVFAQLAQPTRLDLRAPGADPETDAPAKTVVAVLATDKLSGTLELSEAEVRELGRGAHELAVTVTDADAQTRVLMRGQFTVRASVGDL